MITINGKKFDLEPDPFGEATEAMAEIFKALEEGNHFNSDAITEEQIEALGQLKLALMELAPATTEIFEPHVKDPET